MNDNRARCCHAGNKISPIILRVIKRSLETYDKIKISLRLLQFDLVFHFSKNDTKKVNYQRYLNF